MLFYRQGPNTSQVYQLSGLSGSSSPPRLFSPEAPYPPAPNASRLLRHLTAEAPIPPRFIRPLRFLNPQAHIGSSVLLLPAPYPPAPHASSPPSQAPKTHGLFMSSFNAKAPMPPRPIRPLRFLNHQAHQAIQDASRLPRLSTQNHLSHLKPHTKCV